MPTFGAPTTPPGKRMLQLAWKEQSIELTDESTKQLILHQATEKLQPLVARQNEETPIVLTEFPAAVTIPEFFAHFQREMVAALEIQYEAIDAIQLRELATE